MLKQNTKQINYFKLMLLFIVLLTTMLFCDFSLAQINNQNINQANELTNNSVEIIAPVQFEADGKIQTSVIQIQPQETRLGTLDQLRKYLAEEAVKEHARHQNTGPIIGTTKRFAPESITFFFANGLVIFENMLSKGYADPVAMERHILALKDPITHLSFFSFMQANGIYMHNKSKALAGFDPHTQAQKMRLLTYKGLSLGSLASSLTADIFMPYKPCLDKVTRKDYRFTKFDEEQCKQGLETAWKQWTLRKKFSQYAPQIMSLLVSQRLAEIAELGVRGSIQNLSKSQVFKKAMSTSERMIFKVSAADVVLTLSPGGFTVKGIRWLGRLTQFTTFMAIDHMVSGPIYRTFNNLWKPMSFDFDALKMNRLWTEADKTDWGPSTAKMSESIETFTNEVQEWRMHLNSHNEQDLNGWLEWNKKILNQIDLTYSFYKTYTDNLFDTLNTGYRIQQNQLPADSMINQSYFPYRTLPLFGVIWPSDASVSPEDQHLLSPQHIERYQINHIKKVVQKYSTQIEKLQINQSKDNFTNILNLLVSNNKNEIARGLVLLNTVVGYYGREAQAKASPIYDKSFFQLSHNLRSELGNPSPALNKGEGLAKAFVLNSSFLETAREANFKWSGSNYSFSSDGDYFFYQMLCGPEKGQMTNNTFFSNNFIPPKLVKTNTNSLFCNKVGAYITSSTLYTAKVDKEKGLVDYITNNLDYSSLGDYRDKSSKGQFDKWWVANIKEPLKERFKESDSQYKKLVDKTFDVVYGNHNSDTKITDKLKSLLNDSSDKLNQSRYLPRTLLQTLEWELQIYTNLLLSLLDGKVKSGININYVEAKVNLYEVNNQDIINLNQAFKDYFQLLKKKDINFEDYSDLKVTIDEHIESLSALAQTEKNESKKSSLIATTKGLTMLEGETRRLLRMKLLLSSSLDLDTKEFLADLNSQKKSEINQRKAFGNAN